MRINQIHYQQYQHTNSTYTQFDRRLSTFPTSVQLWRQLDYTSKYSGRFYVYIYGESRGIDDIIS